MSVAVSSSLGIVAYLALFATVGIIFLLANLILGRFVRPNNPHEEKLEIYECGEPAVGSSFVQFDLRFYVVALLFIIFDVEVAFFFPWATVFGKAMNLADLADRQQVVVAGQFEPEGPAEQSYRELGIERPSAPVAVPPSLEAQITDAQPSDERSNQIVRDGSRQLAVITIVDIGVFFAVLLVGFAYVWKRGDLNWVRALSGDRRMSADGAPPPSERDLEEALSA